jgi:hypothetical protein
MMLLEALKLEDIGVSQLDLKIIVSMETMESLVFFECNIQANTLDKYNTIILQSILETTKLN